jgi:PAS domain S-box-containing protein
MINELDILKASILIVDDQQADVSLLEHALRAAGYVAIASTMNPQEVCELHRKNRYDLILLDLRMPDLDGFQVMEGLKAIETEGYLSVLVFTAHPTHKLRALKAGAKDFVSKPFDLAEVLLRVHNLLEVRLLHLESSLRTEQAEKRTEQVEARGAEMIRASDLNYRRLFETAKDGIMILDAETGRIGDVNPFLTELLGFSHNEIVGKIVWELSPFKDIELNQVMLLRLQKDPYVRYENMLLETRVGRKISVEFVSNLYQAEEGDMIQCNLRDITERKQVEEVRDRLAAIVDSSDDAIISKTRDGTISAWNRGAEKVFGYSAAEMVGKPILVLLPPECIDEESDILARSSRGESIDQLETVRIRKDGTKINVSVTISPIRDGNGAIVGTSKVARDITLKKAHELEILSLNEDLEDRIVKRTEQLAAANHELEAFSYSVSHDLRAPLRHIAGFSRILVNRFGPVMAVDAREYLQLIEDAVHRMGLLVEGLLSLAKLGQQSLKLCGTELNAIVDDVISILEPECKGREVEWRIAKLPALDCDPILMAQVFQNLLGNALKYSRNKAYAVIEVDSIQQPGKPPVIFVRDNGAGFNRKYADSLFGVFQRFHTDSEFEGTGVGLATVHRIIQKHGGTIWAESEPDHGATFYFALQMTDQIVATRKATAASWLGR